MNDCRVCDRPNRGLKEVWTIGIKTHNSKAKVYVVSIKQYAKIRWKVAMNGNLAIVEYRTIRQVNKQPKWFCIASRQKVNLNLWSKRRPQESGFSVLLRAPRNHSLNPILHASIIATKTQLASKRTVTRVMMYQWVMSNVRKRFTNQTSLLGNQRVVKYIKYCPPRIPNSKYF